MNTRHAIQTSNVPAVLSIAFSGTRDRRFIVGTSEGLRILRLDNCLTTYQPQLSSPGTALTDGGIGIAEVLDTRRLAYVAGGRIPQGSINHWMWHDRQTGNSVRYDMHEPVVGVKLGSTHAAAVLIERTVVFANQTLKTGEIAPNYADTIHRTARNPWGLCVLRQDVIVLPAQSVGQVQLVPLPNGSKRVFRAHNTQLRALALSEDASLLATASVQGTLVRVFDTSTLDQVAEFRRGVDHAAIYSLAFSPRNRWLACSSDKGTVHIFDLRPNTVDKTPPVAHHNPTTGSRPSSAAFTPSPAQPSPPASVQYQGSIQEYYGLLPPPPQATNSATQTAAGSALNALRQSPFAPRALKDVRSVASASFHMGDEPVHWQGGSSHTWTVAPNGTRRRVRREVPPVSNDPSGRPPKGVLIFALEEDDDTGALLYCIGGGSDARWERFHLSRRSAANGANEWVLVHAGYRRYLTEQFPEE